MTSLARVAVPAAGSLAATLLLAGCGGADDEPRTPVARELTVAEAAAVPCPAEPPLPREMAGPGTLPEAPLAVRLCPGPDPQMSVAVPPDAVATQGLEEVVDLVNALPEAAPDQPCTMELGRSYTLLVTYADGESVLVGGQLFGCRNVRVGSVDRAGGAADLHTLVDRLLRNGG